ncbi:MAG TPA: peptidoglycan-binding domain-containing protein, partial [Acidimicrobiales bacterium]
LIGATVLTLGIATWGTSTVLDGNHAVEAATSSDVDGVSTAEVERRDLVESLLEVGTIGYVDAPSLRGRRHGTITWLPDPGTVIERGQTAYAVDERPIPLLYGTIPMWRPLGIGAEGSDVAQLEENLIAMGYATEAQLRSDSKYDSRTAAAVKRWQKDLGVEQTGEVGLGDVEIADGPRRVEKQVAAVGDMSGSGSPVLDVTSTERVVTIDLDASRQSLVAAGDPVQIELPDGTTTSGTIREVGRVATIDETQPGGDPTIDVTVTLDDPATGAGFDAAPVSVAITKSTAEDVLAVPVRALLALAEGGYAVEVVHAGGRQLVGVELGSFADGWVEVSGNLREGDVVVTAS